MTTETVLRKSWDLFTKHWQFVALVSLIAFAVNAVLAVLMGGSVAGGLAGMMASSGADAGFNSLFTTAGLASLGFGAIVTLLVAPLLAGAEAQAGRAIVDGKIGSPVQPFQAALSKYGTYLLLGIVLAIALGIGFALLLIPGVILAVLLGLAPTIVAFEGVGVGEALQRAWALGLKHFWTILLVGAIVAAVSFALSLVLAWVPLASGYVATVVITFGAIVLAVIYTESK